QPESEEYAYRSAGGGPTLTAHYDPRHSAAAETSLPYRTDPVTCATSGHRIVVVYSTPAYPATPPAEIVSAIRTAVTRMNSKIISESRNSSGNARALTMRVDCDGNGTINVYGLSSGSDGAEDQQAAAKAAFGDPSGASSVKYLIFRDAPPYEG